MTATILPCRPNTCRTCLGVSNGKPCVACNGSGVVRADAAMREHGAYGWGYAAHGGPAGAHDSPYSPGTFADRCWRAGWLQAERDAIADSHAEKAEAERMHGA